ncbi:MAG: MBL fold metallo-hydrolase, partial [Firmicutes bacterium]|nr:MBL fold metallo-hydrolase [Bacillota bacterium]
MEIIWHGHSCFELVSGGFSLVLDPYYHRELCGYPELRLTADAVLCSHGHYGHGWTEAVELRRGGAPDPFEVEVLETHHDVLGGRLRGENRIH